MKNLATLLKEVKEANKNMVKFINAGNDQCAFMWANKVAQLEKEIEDHKTI